VQKLIVNDTFVASIFSNNIDIASAVTKKKKEKSRTADYKSILEDAVCGATTHCS
jgi:hypothetical protein